MNYINHFESIYLLNIYNYYKRKKTKIMKLKIAIPYKKKEMISLYILITSFIIIRFIINILIQVDLNYNHDDLYNEEKKPAKLKFYSIYIFIILFYL